MEFNDNVNYVILTNNNDKEFMASLSMYQVLGVLEFNKLQATLEMFPSRRVVFNESLSVLSKKEKLIIFNLLEKQNISYIIVTSDVEDTIYSDYIIVYDGNKKVLEGNKEMVLKNEKILKKTGFGLPFAVELSSGLVYYDILDRVYFDIDSLMEVLWN